MGIQRATIVERLLLSQKILSSSTSPESQHPADDPLSSSSVVVASSPPPTTGRVQWAVIPTLSVVSSTLARSTTDETLLREWLSPDVVDYIKRREMYAFGGEA